MKEKERKGANARMRGAALLLAAALFIGCAGISAVGAKGAQWDAHYAYMIGQEKFFYPERTLSRAETAVLLGRLYPDEMAERLAERQEEDRILGRSGPAYTDVIKGSWYESAVLEAYGVMRGHQNRFRPGDPITLEEYATVLLRVCGIRQKQVNGAAVSALTQAAELGWVDGRQYRDGSMLMNRGLAAAMANRSAGREADSAFLEEAGVYFLDVTENTPYYGDILEAAVDHVYVATGGGEQWQEDSVLKKPLEPGRYAVTGSVYEVQEDGTVICETSAVFFSGDSELDGYLHSVLDGCTTEKMTQTEKLRAAFDHVRGFSYLGRNATLDASVKIMPESNAIGYAKKIFATGKGDCYNFAAAFYYLARALGYEAKAIVGDCLYVWNTRAIAHGWVEIEQGGEWYLYDPEIENYNIRQGISNTARGAFGVTYATAPGTYIPH